jgi:Response regulators consisting of a CheY-like receiver domain and a winged-helix DNA-binding domain
MTRILIVDDDPRITALLETGLRRAGYETATAGDGASAVEVARHAPPDLVLLDVGLPDVDGMSVLATLRAHDPTQPVLLVTGRDGPGDAVRGLESGADDYITKPFDIGEVVARVGARLRVRAGGGTVLRHGRVALDLLHRVATVDEVRVELSAREWTLAEVFLRHPDQALDREELLRRVWALDFDPGSNVVDVYVAYLRRKLGDAFVETVRGVGYRLGPPHS